MKPDTVEFTCDISSAAITKAKAGPRHRVLADERCTVTNNDGQVLEVIFKVTTKAAIKMPKAPGYGLSGNKLTSAPHRA